MENKLYTVEYKEHCLSINNKPVFATNFFFFTNGLDAKLKSKDLRSKVQYISTKTKIRAYEVKDKNFFKWYSINKHKSIGNGVEKEYYHLRGVVNRINSTTGQLINIDQEFNLEDGLIIKEFLKQFITNNN